MRNLSVRNLFLGGYHRLTSYNLGPKLFFSHFVVALAATLTFVAISMLASSFLGNLLAGFAATVAAVLTSLFVTGRIVGPVKRMLEATRRIASGRYSERVPVQEPDELGVLSEGFNAMAKALEEGESRRREFIVDISHELKTPLSTLEGYLEGMTNGVVEPSEESLGLLYAEAGRMRRLIDDLRQLSRVEAGRLSFDLISVSVDKTVHATVDSAHPLFEAKGVKLKILSCPQNLRVLADEDRIMQVLANLLSNALRHTPPGETVTVSAKARDGAILFVVSDTGIGISSEHLPRLFERFYRVEKSRSREGGGSGLGLSISRALVEAMGGRMWAESAGEGRGATFSFTLPLAPR